MFAKQSVCNKLLVINFVATLFAILVAGFFWLSVALQNYIDYFNERISNQAHLVANNSSAAVIFQDWEEVQVILSALKTDSAIVSASIITDDLTNEFSVDFKELPYQVRHFDWLFSSLRKKTGSIKVPIIFADNQIAELELSYHTNEIYDAFTDIVLSLVYIAVLAIVLGAVVLRRIQYLVTRPLHNLSQLARNVTESNNYSLRGTISYNDEIGHLTEDVNSMLDIIERRDIDLERKVKERTAQLETKNVELEHQIQERSRAEAEKREVEERFEQAFINAPIGMALINADQLVFRVNESFSRIQDANHIEIYLKEFIESAAYCEVNVRFSSLVQGKISSFDMDVECFDIKGKLMSAVMSFSAIRNDADEFRYAVLQLQDVTESKKLSKELEYQACHDALTSLPNRRLLKEAVLAASNRSPFKQFALCILDLDQFKVVNDACGHLAGDELLRQVSNIIRSLVRPNDLVARLGGDEFAVLLNDCDAETVASITESIRESIEHWVFNYDGTNFRVGASIGVTIVDRPSMDMSELFKQADTACYVAKDSGRNRVHIIEGENGEVHQRQGEMIWVQRLHDALDNDKFVLYGQTVAPLNSEHKGERKEILLRLWDDVEQRIIPPGAFIPAAERYGMMDKIDRWVIKQLLTLLKENEELYDAGQSYWVNLSGLSLGSKNFLNDLEDIIRNSGIPSGTVNFEITETAVMSNIAEARKFMESVKPLGCKFALDDFGSGMSSFGYLKNLPVDYIKIDGMFVRDILKDEVDLIFVKSIIDIAKVMGLETIAEYVESEEIKDVLTDLGTNYGQGFALGEPVPLLFDSAFYQQLRRKAS